MAIYSGLYTDIMKRKNGRIMEADFNSDTNVYVCAYSKSNQMRFSIGSISDIVAIPIAGDKLFNNGDF